MKFQIYLESQCRNIPYRPSNRAPFSLHLTRRPAQGEVCYVEDAECLAVRAENEREEEEKSRRRAEAYRRDLTIWNADYSALSDECQVWKKERDGIAACQKEYGATCNADNYKDTASCISARSSLPVPD